MPEEEASPASSRRRTRRSWGGGPLPVTVEDARRSIQSAAALYHSAATATDVPLPLAHDHPTYRGWS